MASYLTKVTSKGQVTIPKAVRERFDIEAGDYLLFDPQGDELIVRKGQMVTDDALEEDFDNLLNSIAQQFEERGITRADIEDAIRWAREK
jgi:antitoxin PrlF